MNNDKIKIVNCNITEKEFINRFINKDILFIDTEYICICKEIWEPTQIALVGYNYEKLWLVKPNKITETKAIKYFTKRKQNKDFDPKSQIPIVQEVFNNGSDQLMVIKDLFTLFNNKILIGWNCIQNDYEMLKTLAHNYESLGNNLPTPSLVIINFNEISSQLNWDIPPISYSQFNLGELLKIKNDNIHTALGDAVQLKKIYKKLMNSKYKQEIINILTKEFINVKKKNK